MAKKIFVLLALVIVALLAAGCNDHEETSQTFEVAPAAGTNTRMMTIASDLYYWDDQAEEVTQELDELVNSGAYNILYVKTSYSDEYMTSAEIGYDISGPGRGNSLRVLLIKSDKYYYDDQEKEVQAELEKVVNSGAYNIAKIQTVYISDHLIAAEVYYWVGDGEPLAA
jgi:hypothetical protein